MPQGGTPMARIDEIAPDLFRISAYASAFDLQFNHFLVRDEEPLLFHTGMRRMFPEIEVFSAEQLRQLPRTEVRLQVFGSRGQAGDALIAEYILEHAGAIERRPADA
jgi:hypothetical protein